MIVSDCVEFGHFKNTDMKVFLFIFNIIVQTPAEYARSNGKIQVADMIDNFQVVFIIFKKFDVTDIFLTIQDIPVTNREFWIMNIEINGFLKDVKEPEDGDVQIWVDLSNFLWIPKK